MKKLSLLTMILALLTITGCALQIQVQPTPQET